MHITEIKTVTKAQLGQSTLRNGSGFDFMGIGDGRFYDDAAPEFYRWRSHVFDFSLRVYLKKREMESPGTARRIKACLDHRIGGLPLGGSPLGSL